MNDKTRVANVQAARVRVRERAAEVEAQKVDREKSDEDRIAEYAGIVGTLHSKVAGIIAADIIKAKRAGATRQRCIRAIVECVDFEGNPFSFYLEGPSNPQQTKRMVDTYLKVGIVEKTELSRRGSRAKYGLTEKYLSLINVPIPEERALIIEKMKEEEALAVEKMKAKLFIQSAIERSTSTLRPKGSLAHIVETIVNNLAQGPLTLAELRTFALSSRTLHRALFHIRKAGYLKVSGLGRSIRIYSLIDPSASPGQALESKSN